MNLRPKRRDAGFTLGELFTVIVVVGLLLAYWSSTQRVPRAAQLALCKRNAMQTMMAITQFSHDHAGFLPDVCFCEDLWSSSSLDHYIVKSAVYACPADLGCTWPANNDSSVFNETKKRASYMYAACGRATSGVRGLTIAGHGLRVTDMILKRADHKAVLFEPTLDSLNDDEQIKWHSDRRGGVIAFLDGHSDFVTTNYSRLTTNNGGRVYY